MLQELLKKLELSDKEIEVYLSLFEHGKTTPARIAKATKINRSTVYAVLSQLKEKGLVIEDLSTKVLYFSPASADDVEEMFYQEQEKLKEKKKVAAKLAEEIEKMPQSRKYAIPKIRFIEEADLEEFMYQQMPKWNDSARMFDDTCWGFQDHSFVENYQDFIQWAWKKYHLQVNLLSNESDIEKKMKKAYDKSRDIQFWAKDLEFTSSTWIVGDYLVMIITRQKPFYLVEIHDAVLAHNMREVFKKIWKDMK
jgi:sugar-specific transcriptional regulator TrmB